MNILDNDQGNAVQFGKMPLCIWINKTEWKEKEQTSKKLAKRQKANVLYNIVICIAECNKETIVFMSLLIVV